MRNNAGAAGLPGGSACCIEIDLHVLHRILAVAMHLQYAYMRHTVRVYLWLQ